MKKGGFISVRVPVTLIVAVFVTAISAFVPSAGNAREPSPTVSGESPDEGGVREVTSPFGLDEVVVTATRHPTAARELPVRVDVITEEEIAESRAKDLSELLSEKLPTHFHKYPGALSSVEIRGFRSDTHGADIKGRVLILIDGHRAGTGNIALIPLENVERVEIVRGPGSVIYGSAAMGGVINVITRKGKGNPSARGSVEYGSWDQVRASAGASSGFFDDAVGFSLTARTARQNDDYETGGGQKVPNTEYKDEAYSLSLHASPFPHHTLSASGSYFRAWDVGSPGPTYDPDDDDYKDILRRYGSVAYDGGLPDWDVLWHISYYHVLDRNEWNDPAVAWGYQSDTTETETQGTRSHVSFPTFSLGRLLLGFDWDRFDVSSFTEPAGYVRTPDSRYDNFAFFAEEKLDWNRFSFLMGLRYDTFEETLQPTEGLHVVSREETFEHLSWRTGATFFATDWLSARAAIGTGFRAPTADELSGRFERTYSKLVGNPDLDPETSITYEAGLDVVYGEFKAGLGFFYTDYTDRIVSGFSTCVGEDCSWTTYDNVDGATLSGIEGYGEYIFPFSYKDRTFRLTPFADFTYYTQRKVEDREYRETLGSDTVPSVSKANLTGGLKFDFDRKADLVFTALYHGLQKVQDWNWMSPTYETAVDKGGFTLFSTRLSVHPMEHFDVYLSVENLTDKDYAFVDGYPMPGRTVRAGLEVRY